MVFARQIAMYLARNLTDHSFPEIGQKIGGRDQTPTVIYATNKMIKGIDMDSKLKSLIQDIEDNLINRA